MVFRFEISMVELLLKHLFKVRKVENQIFYFFWSLDHLGQGHEPIIDLS